MFRNIAKKIFEVFGRHEFHYASHEYGDYVVRLNVSEWYLGDGRAYREVYCEAKSPRDSVWFRDMYFDGVPLLQDSRISEPRRERQIKNTVMECQMAIADSGDSDEETARLLQEGLHGQ